MIHEYALAVLLPWFCGVFSAQNAVRFSALMIFSHQGLRYKVLLFLRGFVRRFSGEYFYLAMFWWSVLFRCCSAYVFVHFCGSSSEKRQKNSFFVRSRFWGLVLLVLGFCVVIVVRALSVCSSSSPFSVFLRKQDQVVAGHTHTPPCTFLVLVPFRLLFCPLAAVLLFVPTLFAARPSSSCGLSGVCFLPPCVFGIFSRLVPCCVFGPLILRLGRWAAGCLVSPSVVLVFPLLLCLRLHTCF